MKTKTGVAVGGVWQQDGNNPSSRGQSLANSEQLCYKTSKQNDPDARFCPAEGYCSKPGMGLFMSGGDAALMRGEDLKFPVYWGAGQCGGWCWWGKGQGREMSREAGDVHCDRGAAVTWSWSWRWSGARDVHARATVVLRQFRFLKSPEHWDLLQSLGMGLH